MKLALALAPLLALSGIALAQTRTLKRGDRPVLVSAQELAVLCRDPAADLLGDHPLFDPNKKFTFTMDDIGAIGRCRGYIEGTLDEIMEASGKFPASHYHPVPTEIEGGIGLLIKTFLKRVADHPEELDLAANTVLKKASKTMADAHLPH